MRAFALKRRLWSVNRGAGLWIVQCQSFLGLVLGPPPQVVRSTTGALCGVLLLALAGCDDSRVQEKPPAPRQLQTGADPIHETRAHSEATVAKPQPQDYPRYIGFWLAYGLYHSSDTPIHLSLIEPLGLFGAIVDPASNWNSADYEVDSQRELFLPLNFDLARALLGRDLVVGERVFLHDCQREEYPNSQERHRAMNAIKNNKSKGVWLICGSDGSLSLCLDPDQLSGRHELISNVVSVNQNLVRHMIGHELARDGSAYIHDPKVVFKVIETKRP